MNQVASNVVDLKCDFKANPRVGLTCNVMNVVIGKEDSVKIEKLSNDEVSNLNFYGSTLNHFPNQIFQDFPHLISINVQVSGLSEINQESFKGSINMKDFLARGNKVRRLETDTFIEAINLEILMMHDNAISYIDENVFRNCSKLQEIYLGDNYIEELRGNTFQVMIFFILQNNVNEIIFQGSTQFEENLPIL